MTTTDGSEFDAIAAEYDRVRPSYPDALVDAACDRARLEAGARVLEIGCGTGLLTELLLARDLIVEAVDPGPSMVDAARTRTGDADVRFHVGRFEDVDLPRESFAAVFSGTAFHWVDPTVGWSKVAAVLEPAGVLALLQTGLPALVYEFDRAVWRSALPPEQVWPATDPYDVWSGAEARRANVSELWGWLMRHDLGSPDAAQLFDDVRLLATGVPVEHTAESYLALIATTSTYLRLEPARQGMLDRAMHETFAALGGSHRWVDYATLVTARRRP